VGEVVGGEDGRDERVAAAPLGVPGVGAGADGGEERVEAVEREGAVGEEEWEEGMEEADEEGRRRAGRVRVEGGEQRGGVGEASELGQGEGGESGEEEAVVRMRRVGRVGEVGEERLPLPASGQVVGDREIGEAWSGDVGRRRRGRGGWGGGSSHGAARDRDCRDLEDEKSARPSTGGVGWK